MPERLSERAAAPAPGHTSSEPEQRLATIRRTDRTELRVSLGTFKGVHFVSIREWFLGTRGDAVWLPGKKGLGIKLRELAEVTRALHKAADIEGIKPGGAA